MLRCPAVLLRDRVRIVTRHLDGRPAKTGLLLALSHYRVEHCGVEVAEGVKMDVGGHARQLAHSAEGLAHGVRVGRLLTGGINREDEPVVNEVELTVVRQGAITVVQL